LRKIPPEPYCSGKINCEQHDEVLANKNTNNEAKPWYGQRQQNQPITLFELPLPSDLPTGKYCLYGILSPEQADVFETLKKGLWVSTQQCFEIIL